MHVRDVWQRKNYSLKQSQRRQRISSTSPSQARCARRTSTYAMSVITSRALPDVRDGLKPSAPPHPLRHAPDRPHADGKIPQIGDGRGRGARLVPSARRCVRLRRDGEARAGFSPPAIRSCRARATSAPSTATRLPRTAIRGEDVAHGGRDAPRPREGNRGLEPELRRLEAGAERASERRPEPAPQRRPRHRRGQWRRTSRRTTCAKSPMRRCISSITRTRRRKTCSSS